MFGRLDVSVCEALCSDNTGKCSSEILVMNLSFVKNWMLLMNLESMHLHFSLCKEEPLLSSVTFVTPVCHTSQT